MDVDPLPQSEISKVLGLLEILEDHGGKEDIYKLARELHYESSDLVEVIRGAELLGLVTTPGGDVELLEAGRRVNAGDQNAIKSLLKERMLNIPIFQYFKKMLEGEEDHRMSRKDLLDELARILPKTNPDQQFHALVAWGRYAEVFGYNRDHDLFYLDEGQTLE